MVRGAQSLLSLEDCGYRNWTYLAWGEGSPVTCSKSIVEMFRDLEKVALPFLQSLTLSEKALISERFFSASKCQVQSISSLGLYSVFGYTGLAMPPERSKFTQAAGLLRCL